MLLAPAVDVPPAPTPRKVLVSLYAFVLTLLPDIVIVPVDEIEEAVMEPALSTTKFPLATDIVPVVLMLMFVARSLPVIEPSTIEPLLTELVPTEEPEIPVNCEPSPINPAAVTVPFAKILLRKRTVVVPWVVTLADIVPTDKNPPVIVPRFDTVILAAVIEPFSSTTKALFAAVSVPVDAIEEAVTEPVDVIVVAVIEPVLSTLKLPALTVNEPIFNVVSVMLSVSEMSLPVIELSTIVELLTEFALGVPDDPDIPVKPEPSPTNPVAVIVPTTWSVVDGVVVPMPTLLVEKSP